MKKIRRNSRRKLMSKESEEEEETSMSMAKASRNESLSYNEWRIIMKEIWRNIENGEMKKMK